jgi:hypothetical protein
MKKDKKRYTNYRTKYYKLIHRVIKYRNRGENPPMHLLKQIREIEPLAGIRRENMENI